MATAEKKVVKQRAQRPALAEALGNVMDSEQRGSRTLPSFDSFE